jgi:hypothetical protein
MPIELEAQAPIGGVKPEATERRTVGVSVKTITPSVYITGLYTGNAQAKAAELTRLMQNLLAFGIWESALDAAKKGVPAGTFIIVDDPETAPEDFTVQIVPKIFKKRPIDAVEVGPRQ